jgi:hypothetical protein
MITVGFDFGTHQTKICYETIEAGTAFYEVVRFERPNGEVSLTLPSYIRLNPEGRLRYGYDAISGDTNGKSITYFKQAMFSWTSSPEARIEAEQWSALYLAFVIFKLDTKLQSTRYVVQMGMPTDADPLHYNFCKRQAIKVMVSAMQIAREIFRGDLDGYLSTSYLQLRDLAAKCISAVPDDIREARKKYPIFVFPEAYVALIPLINDRRLPNIGPNLFVDIGGGTVDISFFTAHEGSVPWLYYYYSMPCGLNMITGRDRSGSHNVKVGQAQITRQCVDVFRQKMICAVDAMMSILRQIYVQMGRVNVMPFSNLCGQILDGRPICYSGGGSMFSGLKLPLANRHNGICYNFSQVATVSELIDHSNLYVDDRMFHVLATAFALSHQSLINRTNGAEPDSIRLAPVERLFMGIRNPQTGGQRVDVQFHYMTDISTSLSGVSPTGGSEQAQKSSDGQASAGHALLKCPHCGVLVSERKMARHIRRVHTSPVANVVKTHPVTTRYTPDPEDIQRELYGDC